MLSFSCFKPGSIKTGWFFAVLFILLIPVAGFCQDSDPPVDTSININSGDAYSSSRPVSISLSASDPGGGVTGYYLSEDSTDPSGATFSIVSPTQTLSTTVSFTLSEDDGSKTVYAWFKDASDNISSVTSDSIVLDTTAPADGLVRINDDSGSVTTSQVTVTISATDNYSIAGYLVSESSSTPEAPEDFTLLETPAASLNTSFSFNLSTTAGTKTLYAWFIDEAGNISSPANTTVDFDYGWFRFYDIGAEDDISGIGIPTYAYEMIMDDSGNMYIVGITHGDMGGDTNNTLYGSAFVTKLNSAGDVVWSRLLETTDSDSSKGEHIAVDSEGNVFIAGDYDYYIDYVYPDAFLAKFDSSGNQLWLKTYPGVNYDDVVYVRDIDVDGSNNIYLLGYTSDDLDLSDTVTIANVYGSGSGKFLAKYDSSGNLSWGFSSDDLVGQGAMAVDNSGNIYMAGATLLGTDLLMSKFNSSGTNIWTREWGYSESYREYCENLTLDSYGNLYVAGFVFPEGEGVTSGTGFVGKFDHNGDAEASGQWYDIMDPLDPSDDYMVSDSIALDSRGNVYITGDIALPLDGNGDYQGADMYVRKYSSTGTEIWTKRLGDGGIEGETPESICIGIGDFVYILGDQYNHNTLPGIAGQKYDYNLSYEDTFIWKSSSDSEFDLTLPTGSFTINSGDTSVIGNIVTLNLSASDNTGVTGYYVSETDMLPSPGVFTTIDETTEFTAGVQYTFDTITTETKTVYVWYRDAFGNFSNPRASASIEMTGDTVDPVGGTPVIDGGAEESESTTVSVEISATDNVAVTGYYVTDEIVTPTADDFTAVDTPSQSFSATVSYTLTDTTPGPFFIYAYFIDAAGNISDYAQAQGDLADTTPPVTTADPDSGYYDGPVTVTLNATDDYYVLFTYYMIESEGILHYYSEPFEVTSPDRVLFLSEDLDGNIEAAQIVTYGLEQSFSGAVSASVTGSIDIEAANGTNLKISFSLDGTVSQAIPVILRQPDGTVYDTYYYTGGTLDTIITGAAGGTWSLEVDNTSGDTVLNYQLNTKQLPTGGCIDGSDFDGDGTVDCDEECPFDPDKIEAGSCGCGVEDIDTDSDGSMDCIDTDDDNDGMPDEWEEANGLDPLYDNADEDEDGDGFKNILEYKRGTDPLDPESHPSRAMPWLPLLLED